MDNAKLRLIAYYMLGRSFEQAKKIAEEEINAEPPSQPKAPRVVQVPTLSEQATVFSDDPKSVALPVLRREPESELENQNGKGGDRTKTDIIARSLGTLAVWLTLIVVVLSTGCAMADAYQDEIDEKRYECCVELNLDSCYWLHDHGQEWCD